MSEKIKVVIKEPYQSPYIATIKNELETFQEIVGGLIQCVPLNPYKNTDIDIYLNDEGKLEGLPLNLSYYGFDILVGTVFFARHDGEGGTVSLTDKDIVKVMKFIEETRIS